MTQTDLIIKLAELDAEISRAQIAVDEASAKLRGLRDRRDQLSRECTHKDGRGASLWDEVRDECTLCGEVDH